MKDTYKTIQKQVLESFFKEKGSKFYGYAFPVESEEEIKLGLAQLKQQHPTAGHYCFAWQLGKEVFRFRVNDDGEPSNTAGMPIFGQIQAFGLTNILVVIVRYFGGTKLGVGGLIQAYKKTAQITLDEVTIVEKTIDVYYQLRFDYALMNKVMRIVKEKNINVLHQELGIDCVFRIAIRKTAAVELMQRFKHLYKVEVEKID